MINRTTQITIRTFALVFAMCVLAGSADANRRHFAYTYESPVLPSASREIEIWNTLRTDKGVYYRGIDHRMELEWGLGSGLQSSLYLNMSQEGGADGLGGFFKTSEFSFANEWKLNLTNPYADVVGSALYAEWTVEGDATELEGKLILDKQIGDILVAGNATYEHEFPALGVFKKNSVEATLGVAYLASDALSIGIEARHHTVTLDEGSFPAFFVGPSITYAGKNWWAAATVMPQIGIGSKQSDTGSALDLAEHEKVEVRFLLSFEL
jgi:hypothetical protein